ncbi:hypothetical protein [Ensifer sp. LBL]|uniref:Abi-alpha family protein n=1 Tax=Ensifer sp. LBL TaxID=2991056 RepID=UPI003D1DD8F8
MTDDKSKNPLSISIDVGARAEIKAEIPATSSGRLIDALTDVIRPFTESRGLRADQIRLQREDVLISIARKARERLVAEGFPTRAVPNKTLVPLLEKASLEDPSDDEMIERWANLLVSEVSDPGPNRRWCIQILGEIDAAEAQILDDVYFEHSKHSVFETANYTRRAADSEFESMLKNASLVPKDDIRGIIHSYFGLSLLFDGDNIPNTNEFSLQDFPLGLSLLHLQTLGLIWLNASSFVSGGVRSFLVCAHLTPLGFEFVRNCRRSDDV